VALQKAVNSDDTDLIYITLILCILCLYPVKHISIYIQVHIYIYIYIYITIGGGSGTAEGCQ
jgi:hypothetical protein